MHNNLTYLNKRCAQLLNLPDSPSCKRPDLHFPPLFFCYLRIENHFRSAGVAVWHVATEAMVTYCPLVTEVQDECFIGSCQSGLQQSFHIVFIYFFDYHPQVWFIYFILNDVI